MERRERRQGAREGTSETIGGGSYFGNLGRKVEKVLAGKHRHPHVQVRCGSPKTSPCVPCRFSSPFLPAGWPLVRRVPEIRGRFWEKKSRVGTCVIGALYVVVKMVMVHAGFGKPLAPSLIMRGYIIRWTRLCLFSPLPVYLSPRTS